MRRLLASFAFAMGLCLPTAAQKSDSLARWGVSAGVHPGRVLVVDEYQRKWQKGRDNLSFDAMLTHFSLPEDSDAFAADYGYPSISVGMKMAFNHGVTMHKTASPDWGMAEEVDYDSRMGNSVALYGSFARPIVRKKKWELDYTLSTGIAYSHSAYHPQKSVDNELIGSHWLIYFGAGSHLLFRLAPEWGVRLGVDFWHMSNGALSRPNKGVNILGPSAALVYCPYYHHVLAKGEGRCQPKFSPFLFLDFSLGVGAKTLNEDWLETQFNTPKESPDYRTADFKLYMAYSFQANLMYRYARRWASGVGADVFYGSYADRVRQIDEKHLCDVSHSPWSLGVALKHQVYYHQLALSMSLGYYLFRKMGQNASAIEKPYYERIGLHYSLPVAGITVGFNIKAHLTKADLVEINLAKVLRL